MICNIYNIFLLYLNCLRPINWTINRNFCLCIHLLMARSVKTNDKNEVGYYWNLYEQISLQKASLSYYTPSSTERTCRNFNNELTKRNPWSVPERPIYEWLVIEKLQRGWQMFSKIWGDIANGCRSDSSLIR